MSYFRYEGKQIYYEEFGEGLPLILLHGNTSCGKMFDSIVPVFAAKYTVIVPDFLGNGRSERIERWPSDLWFDWAKQVKALCDHLGLKKVKLIGTSGGALAAINVALEYPELVESFIADSFEGLKANRKITEQIRNGRAQAKTFDGFVEYLKTLHGDDWEQVFDADTDAVLRHAEQIGEFFHKPIDELKVPMLLTGSLEDDMFPKGHCKVLFDEICAKTSFAKAHIFEHGGHPAMISNTDEFAELFSDILNEPLTPSPRSIRALEKKATKGWVAFETIEYDGWEMRFGNGYTGRANSVSVYEDSTKRMKDKVTYCENIYASKGLPCNFKVTEADKELSEFLKNRDYKIVTPSDVMILDTDGDEFLKALEDEGITDNSVVFKDVIFTDSPSEWFDPYFEFEGFTDEKKIEAYKQFHANTKITKLYVTVLYEGTIAAVASCAIEGEYSLLHNVIVDKKYRGLHLGKKLCLASILKSKEMGAKYSYLQVIKDNDVAVNLYKKLGYKKVYEYCYLKQNKEMRKQ